MSNVPVCGCATPDMELGVSEKWHARSCAVSENEYLQMLCDRAEELGRLPPVVRRPENRVTSITAKRPVLVVGGGASVTWENTELIRGFRGTIITCEISFRYLLSLHIIPAYVATLEKAVDEVHLPSDEDINQCRGRTTVIASSLTRGNVIARLERCNVPVKRYITGVEPRLSNVGLFAVHYAKEVLGADKIILLGFEHERSRDKFYPPHIFHEWIADFWHFVDQWPDHLIVNCSNGGVLYKDNVLDGEWPLEVEIDV